MIRTLAAAAAVLSACATSPKSTLSELDRMDPSFRSRECVAARQAAARYDDHKEGKLVVGLLGNLVLPFAGTAATAAMTALQQDDQKALNHRLRAACTSDPLAGRRRVARR
jgi:hypothetical protein